MPATLNLEHAWGLDHVTNLPWLAGFTEATVPRSQLLSARTHGSLGDAKAALKDRAWDMGHSVQELSARKCKARSRRQVC